MKIRETLRPRARQGVYKMVNVFAKFAVGTPKDTIVGRTIEVVGPRKSYTLREAVKPLTIISPPEVEGGDAIQRKLPLFYITLDRRGASMGGASWFALDGDTLIPYRRVSKGVMEPL